jgi:hypothetical protein
MTVDNVDDGQFSDDEDDRNKWWCSMTRVIEGYNINIGHPLISDMDLKRLRHRDFH